MVALLLGAFFGLRALSVEFTALSLCYCAPVKRAKQGRKNATRINNEPVENAREKKYVSGRPSGDS